MKKEEIIKKWLDNELSADEMKQFQQMEEYESYVKISEKAHYFKAPEFDAEQAYKKLKSIVAEKRLAKKRQLNYKSLASIAAAFIIGFLVYTNFLNTEVSVVETMATEKIEVTLPDTSIAQLNSESSISFVEEKWENNRRIELKGEAYFKVAKGKRFDVETNAGVISVLGTEFNVKNRTNFFEVQCFEGKVQVDFNDKEVILTAGKTVRVSYGLVSEPLTDLQAPSWIANKSSFKSVPYAQVLEEFERQYNVEIITDMNSEVLFSGAFSHNNQTSALKSITIPFGLEYTIVNNQITLTKID